MFTFDKKEGAANDMKRFRMMADPLASHPKKEHFNTPLTILPMSGSGQLSLEEFIELRNRLNNQEVIIVDLREESHFFLNGLAVGWCEGHNDGNRGCNLEEILSRENQLIKIVSDQSKIDVVKITGSKTNPVPQKISLEVQTVESEKSICDRLNFNYVRLPITDRRRPSDAAVDQFLNFLKTLKENTWIHFHCKGGAGRTTSLMAMLDMLSHCEHHLVEEIVHRQHYLGGRNLYELPDESAWNYAHAQERTAFLENFYSYCQAREQGFKKNWTDWITSQSA